jgi:predicted transcriptional regulator
MMRTTITLSDDLAALVRQEAARRGTSVSAVIRQSIHDSLIGSGKRSVSWAGICDDPALPRATELEDALEAWNDDLDSRG